ncbi:hypothetical protein FRC17_009283 [Serendipita sp. 399]|nr:hypothetical protein FRC17_009283 [Serendipita sp. 399]
MTTDFSRLSLFVANDEQISVHRKRTFEPWGRGLSLEEFVKRDKTFNSLPHATDGKFTVWILAPRETGHSALDFLCSCETSEREVALSDTILRSCSGKVPLAYGVASVITPPENRGKGYASHMMRLLHYILADPTLSQSFPAFPVEKWGAHPVVPPRFGKGILSVLYSDVGERFYRSCGVGTDGDNGWVVRDPIVAIWKVPSERRVDAASKIEWLKKDDQDHVWQEDATLIRRELKDATSPSFSFLPDNGVAESLQARSYFYSPVVSEGGVWGARLGDDAGLAYATWCLDPGREGPGTMLITRLRATQDQFPTLLYAAFQAARQFGLEQVEIWNFDQALAAVGKDLGGETSRRGDHLSSLAWYGPGNRDEVTWRYNEKFCWC